MADFLCPITGEVMEDPVMAEDKQNYERKAIKESWVKALAWCFGAAVGLECFGLVCWNSGVESCGFLGGDPFGSFSFWPI